MVFDDRNETNIMKKSLLIIIVLSFMDLFSQNMNCLNFELYNSQTDVIPVKYQVDFYKAMSGIELKDNQLQLVALTNSSSEFPKWASHKNNGVNKGFKVLLINNSSKKHSLSNRYGKVVITRQVYFNNEWKNVKSFRKTEQKYCGNALYRKIQILPGSTFAFIAPCIEGNIKTKFRFVAFIKSSYSMHSIYSNEFEGYINRNLIE